MLNKPAGLSLIPVAVPIGLICEVSVNTWERSQCRTRHDGETEADDDWVHSHYRSQHALLLWGDTSLLDSLNQVGRATIPPHSFPSRSSNTRNWNTDWPVCVLCILFCSYHRVSSVLYGSNTFTCIRFVDMTHTILPCASALKYVVILVIIKQDVSCSVVFLWFMD
jgi:hypothetical protein